MAPTLAVAIVNHNGGERVMRVAEALARQPYPMQEILLVDNASIDGSAGRIERRFPNMRVMHLPSNIGLSAARNLALQELTADLVLMLDHDVYVDGDCVARLVSAQLASGAALVCPRIRLVPESDTVQADGAEPHFIGTLQLRHAYVAVESVEPTGAAVMGCIGACMLVDRDRIRAAGGFDPLFFFYFEDLEISLRLRALGHQIWCEATAQVFHERAAGTPGLSFRGRGAYPTRRAYMTMRNRLLTIFIHYRLRTLLLLLPALCFYELVTLLAAVKRGCALAWLRAWAAQAYHAPAIVTRRAAMRRGRVLPDRALLAGGPLPIAPGVVQTRMEARVLDTANRLLDWYWKRVRRFIG